MGQFPLPLACQTRRESPFRGARSHPPECDKAACSQPGSVGCPRCFRIRLVCRIDMRRCEREEGRLRKKSATDEDRALVFRHRRRMEESTGAEKEESLAIYSRVMMLAYCDAQNQVGAEKILTDV